jgi:hypothetical protein
VLVLVLLAALIILGRVFGFVRGMVAFGLCVVALTEGLSAFHGVRMWPLFVGWLVVCAAALAVRPRGGEWPQWAAWAAIAPIAGIVLFIALKSVPNSTDVMAYHLPRVLFWAQNGSVAFFPTHYYNQIMLQPMAEYTVLQTWVLSGSDRYANLVQFLGFFGAAAVVCLIAKEMGGTARGQVMAALICATLPNGILQASGAKNDAYLALWLAAMVYFAVRFDWWWMSAALALALFTKGTAYLFAPAFLAGALGPVAWRERGRLVKALPAIAVCVVAINGPLYWRNYSLSGSILGFDSALGNGTYRWQNEPLSVSAMTSNALRHFSEGVGMRSEAWNRGVYKAVLRVHAALGIDPNDRRTTWQDGQFGPPVNANHETNANNRWHLLLFAVTGVALMFWRKWDWLCFFGSIVVAYLLFCGYLKWQPFMTRMLLPLFVMAAVVSGLVLERMEWTWLQILVCLFLLNNTRPYLLENWTRPLKGPRSILKIAREDGYFADMTVYGNKNEYIEAVRRTLQSGCERVGIDDKVFPLEYPYEALLRAANPRIRFEHVGVMNASARYRQGGEPDVCVVLCLSCGDGPDVRGKFKSVGEPVVIGRSLLFVRK